MTFIIRFTSIFMPWFRWFVEAAGLVVVSVILFVVLRIGRHNAFYWAPSAISTRRHQSGCLWPAIPSSILGFAYVHEFIRIWWLEYLTHGSLKGNTSHHWVRRTSGKTKRGAQKHELYHEQRQLLVGASAFVAPTSSIPPIRHSFRRLVAIISIRLMPFF